MNSIRVEHLNKNDGSNSRRPSLVMTDYFVLLAVFLALLFALDPFILYIDKRTVLKHLHLIIAIPPILLAMAGSSLKPRNLKAKSIWPTFWPLGILASWIICGAIYARFSAGVEATFLIMGLYMFVAIGAARFIADHANPVKLLNFYLLVNILMILLGCAWQIGYAQKWSEFHEEEFLTIPVAVYFYHHAKTSGQRIVALLLVFILMLIVVKNTSFIVAAIALLYIYLVYVRKALAKQLALHRVAGYYFLGIAVLLVMGAYLGIKEYLAGGLPDGNPKYRFFTYEIAISTFLDSPIWGKLFSGAGAEKFGLFEVMATTQILPSHSDILDILAQGGLIGMSLFLFAAWRIIRYVHSGWNDGKYLQSEKHLSAHFHWISLSSLCSIFVLSFNPIMLQPGKAFILWMNVGILVGIAMRCSTGRAEANSVVRN